MSGKSVLIIILVAIFILGSAFGCLVLEPLTPVSMKLNLQQQLIPGHDKAAGEQITGKMVKETPVTNQAKVGACCVKQYSTSVAVGQDASILIKTKPDWICTLRYINPLSMDVTLDGDLYQKADDEGYCRWIWKINEDTTPGAGRIVYSVNGKTGTLFFNIVP